MEVQLSVQQREGLKEQIAQDRAQIDKLLLAIARLEDHIAYCEKKLAE
jgi:hypothetical protein